MSQKRISLLLTHSPSRQMQQRASSLVVSFVVREELLEVLGEVVAACADTAAAVDCWKWHSFSRRSIKSSNCSWLTSFSW